MCRLSNHYHCSTIKHLGRQLTVFLVVAVATPVLLAENNDRDQGRFVDPIVGSWLVHATGDTITPTPSFPLPIKFDALMALWENGILVNYRSCVRYCLWCLEEEWPTQNI
jgi:hypothetical protein